MAETDLVLIDTSAVLALLSRDDRFHESAQSAYNRLLRRRVELWATSYSLVETIALVQNRLKFQGISDFSERYLADLRVFWIDEQVHDTAWARFMESRGQGLSFVDGTIVIASR